MAAFIEVRLPTGSQLRALEGERVSIGRLVGNDIEIGHDDHASRVHAQFERVGPGWMVRDLRSTGGTWVNGKRIVEGCALKDGDELHIGHTRLTYRLVGGEKGDPTMVPQPLPAITPRERQVLIELCRPVFLGSVGGPASVVEIAKSLVVTPDNIRGMLINLYDKFAIHPEPGRNRRVALAAEAVRRGAVTKPDVDAAARPRSTRT